MFRQAFQRLTPVGNFVAHQVQRNIGMSAVVSQKANLDPIQQLFVDKIREYKTKSAGGKLVDASPETEATLKDMLTNLERAFQAKGVDMTQFPTFNFQEPELVWPGLTEEQRVKMYETAEAAEVAIAQAEQVDEDKYDPFEGIP
ncbi:ATP synthase-coupling factor 6, mitochondrial [Aplysia californica]|uniref:ATP synthase-coupling factor 6, mitochondrial n=1 Tax=Aplysia californica TaxID=6500 RepID=A0ABM0JH43_APLCA|nr:ATP synthase-coupling factor 6, mitochondrial [Aplysia californica]XP_005093547.1 ATP synthase-coupling factor 6, mitochondrial [Aplysia californica]